MKEREMCESKQENGALLPYSGGDEWCLRRQTTSPTDREANISRRSQTPLIRYIEMVFRRLDKIFVNLNQSDSKRPPEKIAGRKISCVQVDHQVPVQVQVVVNFVATAIR